MKVVTLDDYCEVEAIAEIAFLKIDTEGHEMAVLRGADMMLSQRRIRAIQIEYSYWWIAARHYLMDLFDYLGTRQYRIFKILPDGIMPLESYRHRLDGFRYGNLLATSGPIDPGMVVRTGASNLLEV